MQLTTRVKRLRINHTEPGEFNLGYVLLPLGYAYNQDVASAKKGDMLVFFDGPAYPIYAVRKIKISSPDADILCRMRYGITIKGALMRWKTNAKMEGHGMRAVSDEECLWVVYGTDSN